MPANPFKHPFTRELERTAKLLQPSEQICQEILGSVLLVAGVTATISFGNAVASGATLAKTALIKTVSATIVTTVGVTAAAVAGPAVLAPPAIAGAYIADTQAWVQAEIQIDMGGSKGLRSVKVISESGEEQAAARRDDGLYVVTVNANGTYTIAVTGAGNRTATANVVVDSIDEAIPALERHAVEGDAIVLFFSDQGSGVEWEAIYATDASGAHIRPLEVDPSTGRVVFAMPTADMNVHVRDLAGNQAICPIHLA